VFFVWQLVLCLYAFVRNENSREITSKCCECTSLVSNISSQMLLDLKSSHDCLNGINFGQLNFRQKGSDKKHTNLSLHRLSMKYDFVFTSDQICSEEYTAIGLMVGTNFSHGFGAYSCVFVVYPRSQQLS